MEKYDFLIDTHSHIDGKEFDEDRENVLNSAVSSNVKYIINVGGTDVLEGSKRAVNFSKKYSFVFATVAQHPQDADSKFDKETLLSLAQNDKVVAIGETGLDFYKNWSNFDNQRNLFREHIRIARDLKMPLIIHCRDAGEDTIKILKEENAKDVGGVFHCFSESYETYKKIVDLNFIVSFTGVITFKNANKVRSVVEKIPLEHIMVETDSPYMTPEPFRGTRCEPMHTFYTAKKLAEIKNISLEDVMDATTRNAIKIFKLDGKLK